MHPALFGGDLHAARAVEMEQLDRHRVAAAIRTCGTRMGPRTIQCKRRMCPSCADDKRRAHADALAKAIRAMRSPVHVVFALPSMDMLNLPSTITNLKGALAALRRRSCFREVQGAVGVTEPERRPFCWYVHTHAILDIDEDVFEDIEPDIASAWSELTDGRGVFSTDPWPVERGCELRLARYITKLLFQCPMPGTTPLHHLDTLIHGLHGRQMVFAWGACSRRRRAAPVGTAPSSGVPSSVDGTVRTSGVPTSGAGTARTSGVPLATVTEASAP